MQTFSFLYPDKPILTIVHPYDNRDIINEIRDYFND